MDLPPCCKPLSSKWVFKRKRKVDYFDTYSPVTRINSIRMVLGIATLRNLEVHQSHYVDNTLGKFDKDDSGIARTPIDVTLHFSKNK